MRYVQKHFYKFFPSHLLKNETIVTNICRRSFSVCSVSARKQDQGAKSDVYAYVPLQDFTVQSEICWENTPAQIDKQLYKKYGLTAQEIEFIEKLPPSSEFD